MQKWFVLFAAAGGALAVALSRAPDPVPGTLIAADAAPARAVTEVAQPAADSARLTRLKSLAFDRRPSAVLAARAAAHTPPADPLDREIDALRRAAVLSDWGHVKAYLASLPEHEGAAGYDRVLRVLQESVPPAGTADATHKPTPAGLAERPVLSVEDVVGLAAAAPKGLNADRIGALAVVLRGAIASGNLPAAAVDRLRAEVAKPAGQAALDRRAAAQLLIGAGEAVLVGEFLPGLDEAAKANDAEGLNLLALCHVARNRRDQSAADLEAAWRATQAVLAGTGGEARHRDEALLRAVELAPRVADALGRVWLEESFTRHPDRGAAILAKVGTLASTWVAAKAANPDERKSVLGLMKTAAEALLRVAPQRAGEWAPTLTVLATTWLREAEFARDHDVTTSAPRMQRDSYGNVYYTTDTGERSRGAAPSPSPTAPRPVPTADMLRARPSDGWVAVLGAPLRSQLLETAARLHLKIGEEVEAFPLIERIAAAHPDEARALVREFLRVWVKNHDMNAESDERRSYSRFYGFDVKMDGIPLTRSKQERNLVDLAGWMARIRKLPGRAAELDGELVVRAFTASHSVAEVYRTEAIEKVFGPLKDLKPAVLAGLGQQMRGNLAGQWQNPKVQAAKKTNRRPKEIEAEVLRGYAVARGMIDDSLKAHPNHFALLGAWAALEHDEVSYRQELNKSSNFTAKRAEALARFRRAAAAYAGAVAALPDDAQGVLLYEQWFAAALGAVDLRAVDEEKQPDWTQPPLIKAALAALPGELAEKHLARFATGLFTRLSAAKPHVKFNYLKAGFQIVGEHPHAAESKKLFEYYKDLVTEIKMTAAVDGSPRVGHGQPFGVLVGIRHTRDIERESGGFGRYLQNQVTGMTSSYNYGRPTADYRDRFEKAARAALGEHFEVVSVTYQVDAVASRALPEDGWRFTPYAYILLKARGPQVDAVPPLRLDLDFLDTSGYVVLPVESPKLPVDCGPTAGDPRPLSAVSVTQTLDDRQIATGTVRLEVRASGTGLVPDLAALFGPVEVPGFTVTGVDDQGAGVKKFGDEGDKVVSERAWVLTLAPAEGAPPERFRFPTARVPVKEAVYQKYADVDLTPVESEAQLGAGPRRSGWWKWTAAGGFIVAVLGVVAVRAIRRPVAIGPEGPIEWTPFGVLQLLRDLRASGAVRAERLSELERDAAAVEGHYFGAGGPGAAPDLPVIAARWRPAVRV